MSRIKISTINLHRVANGTITSSVFIIASGFEIRGEGKTRLIIPRSNVSFSRDNTEIEARYSTSNRCSIVAIVKLSKI